MTNYIYILSLLFLTGCLGLALKPSPIYGGLGLIVSGCVGCLMVLGFGGSFLGLMMFLVYLGGMLVVFGYTTAMATEEYPETWASGWMVFSFLFLGFLMQVGVMYVLDNYKNFDFLNLDSLGYWVIYEVDDVGMVMEGGVGVAAMYSCSTWLMVVAGWSLFACIFIIMEITRD